MTSAYFDCQFGAAGDMLVATLLDAGLDFNAWSKELNKIALPKNSYVIKISKVFRCSISASKFDVELPVNAASHEHNHEHTHEHSHSHEHGHSHEHEHSHSHEHTHAHEHSHTHTHTHEPQRKLSDVLEIIAESKISNKAKELAKRIFERLAKAEGRVHGISPFEVHFHEVGAVDAIIDILGFAIAYDMMGIKHSYVSALPLGSGHVQTEHGLFSVPGPAVLALLEEASTPTSSLNIPYECLTPTGAAILCEISEQWNQQPTFAKITSTGYGAGSKDNPKLPNVCRVVLGQSSANSQPTFNRFSQETIVQIEANIDDSSPQTLSHACNRLFAEGALDVLLIPALMKKGRSGQVLLLLCKPEDQLKLQEIILTETSSIGVRAHSVVRLICQRKWEEVCFPNGEKVRIKIAYDNSDNIINVQPEFDDCAAHASANNLPVKEVIDTALALYQQKKSNALQSK